MKFLFLLYLFLILYCYIAILNYSENQHNILKTRVENIFSEIRLGFYNFYNTFFRLPFIMPILVITTNATKSAFSKESTVLALSKVIANVTGKPESVSLSYIKI